MKEDLVREQRRLEQELKGIKKKLKNYDKYIDLPDDQHLAIHLHDKMCKFNHTDGCDWFYRIKNEVHDWDSYAHKEWLQKASKILKSRLVLESDKPIKKIIDDLTDVLEIIKGY